MAVLNLSTRFSSTLKFPDQKTIQNFLENDHPLSSRFFKLRDKTILKIAAETFANQKTSREHIHLELNFLLDTVDCKISNYSSTEVIDVLSGALLDCSKKLND